MTPTQQNQVDMAASQLKVLAHPARLHIIQCLGRYGQLNSTALQRQLGIQQAVLSHHLIKMRDCNVLRCSRKGREAYYSLAHPQFIDILELLMQTHERRESV